MTLAILGTGGHAKSIYDIVKKKKIYFFDNTKKKFKVGNRIFKVIGNHESMKNHKKKISKVILAIGDNTIRKNYYNILKKNKFKFTTLVNPKSYSSFGSKIGEGCVVLQGSFINTDSIIGNNCIINSKALIEHDCRISEHCHISTNATINGGVIVQSGCFIGSGSITKESITIAKNSFIKAGSLVK